jgi:hypothetical protein
VGFAAGLAVASVGRATAAPAVNREIAECLKKCKIVIHGQTVFERRPADFADRYVRVFHAQPGMALIGVEDLDPGSKPDGWTDVLLPCFWSVAPNRGGVDYPILFVDTAMSGSYTKELFWLVGGQWRRLFYYSTATGMRVLSPDGPMTSVGYIEYDLAKDRVYSPAGVS